MGRYFPPLFHPAAVVPSTTVPMPSPGTAAHDSLRKRRPALEANLGELPIPLVPHEERRLRVADTWLARLNVVLHVAVYLQNILVAVVVIVEEADAEAEGARRRPSHVGCP